MIDLGVSHELVTTDAADGSRVAAVLGAGLGGLSIDYVAHRVVVRFQELGPLEMTIYEPPTGQGGLSGTKITAEGEGRLAEDVALRVYAAWVSGAPRDAADFATEEVLAALEAAPQTSGDAFELVGTTCPVEGPAAVCRFRRGNQVSVWQVRPVDGVLRVVSLR